LDIIDPRFKPWLLKQLERYNQVKLKSLNHFHTLADVRRMLMSQMSDSFHFTYHGIPIMESQESTIMAIDIATPNEDNSHEISVFTNHHSRIRPLYSNLDIMPSWVRRDWPLGTTNIRPLITVVFQPEKGIVKESHEGRAPKSSEVDPWYLDDDVSDEEEEEEPSGPTPKPTRNVTSIPAPRQPHDPADSLAQKMEKMKFVDEPSSIDTGLTSNSVTRTTTIDGQSVSLSTPDGVPRPDRYTLASPGHDSYRRPVPESEVVESSSCGCFGCFKSKPKRQPLPSDY